MTSRKRTIRKLTSIGNLLKDNMKKAIYFGATWCGQCKVFKPKFEEECKRLGLDYEIVDVEEKEELAAQYSVRNIPFVVAIKNEQMQVKGMAADIIPLLEKL